MVNKESIKNLVPFKKGADARRNLAGKNKQLLTKLLDEIAEEITPNGKTHKELIAEKLIELATKGDIKAIQLFIERTEGKEVMKVELKDTSENPNWDIELV